MGFCCQSNYDLLHNFEKIKSALRRLGTLCYQASGFSWFLRFFLSLSSDSHPIKIERESQGNTGALAPQYTKGLTIFQKQ
jgi:hypothetical protein